HRQTPAYLLLQQVLGRFRRQGRLTGDIQGHAAVIALDAGCPPTQGAGQADVVIVPLLQPEYGAAARFAWRLDPQLALQSPAVQRIDRLAVGIPGGCIATEFEGFRSEEHTSELQSRENLVCR